MVAGALLAWGSVRIMTASEPSTLRLAAIVMPAEEGGPSDMTEVFNERMTSPHEATMKTMHRLTAEAAAGGT